MYVAGAVGLSKLMKYGLPWFKSLGAELESKYRMS